MTDPLFVSTIASLKEQLRLSGVASGTDAHRMVESVLGQVRVGFYHRLGITRTVALVAMASVANPTTSDEILHMTAEQCEVVWARMLLLDRLPSVFMDTSGAYAEIIGQEGTSRSMTAEAIAEQRSRAQQQVEEWLALLAGDVDLGDGPDVQIATQGDQLPRVYPNGMLGGANRRLFGDPTRDDL